MELVSKIIHYPFLIRRNGSLGELKLVNDIITLKVEGVPASDLITTDFNKEIFSIPITELRVYSNFIQSDRLYLYVKNKRISVVFASNVSVSKGIWNTLYSNKAANTNINEWLDVFDVYNIPQKFNFRAMFVKTGIGVVIFASFLIRRFVFN